MLIQNEKIQSSEKSNPHLYAPCQNVPMNFEMLSRAIIRASILSHQLDRNMLQAEPGENEWRKSAL